MLNLTRKTDYALVALAYLAQRRAAGEAGVSARRIGDQFNLPLPLLMNILKELTHARIINSTRGQQGGYTLAGPPEEVTLLDVITAMEGPVKLSACSDTLPILGQQCPIQEACLIRGPIRRLHGRIRGFLEEVTLADLIESKVDVSVHELTLDPSTAH